MEIYKLESMDMMGFTIEQKFFLSQEKALEAFDKKIEEYRNDECLASKEDAQEHNISNESISINNNPINKIKSAMTCLWYKCSYEYDEWDITVQHLELEKVEVIE